MTSTNRILLLTQDPSRRERWRRDLEDGAEVSSELISEPLSEEELPEVVVTDQLPLAAPQGPLAELVSRGEVGVIGVGTQAGGDLTLPSDCSGRELSLACHMLVEIVRLRRALVLESRRSRALANLAERDPLTGLANRRKWDRELAERMGRLRDGHEAAVLGVVLLDLDLFKDLNDRFGYVEGDLALQRVAHQLAANLASQQLAARLGGDEFGVLLSGLLASDVPAVADSLRSGLEHTFAWSEDNQSTVTASAGVVIVADSDEARGVDILRAADRALRAAKQQGRNRTVVTELSGES